MSGATERQKLYEDSCRIIAEDLMKQCDELPLSIKLLAKANIIDLFNSIRTAYTNGVADAKDDVK